ncbi:LRR receptor-like serine/threonine-protein kinase EFR [Abeliophyllum distichum]|uniref:LRR receptor-like serine/threonine-protein kinase EFR n=1 Tax=Abeliophyllum distichum TaxID=126358 RepID=A0ABD1QZF6_9LAMI
MSKPTVPISVPQYFSRTYTRSLDNLKGVEFIDLSLNNLAGPIPSLNTLYYLNFLNLSNNMLQREVPKQGIFLNASGVFFSGKAKLWGGISTLGLPKCSSKSV